MFLILGGLVLNERYEGAIRIDQGTDATAPCFHFGRVQPRLSLASLRQTGFFAGRIKGVEIVQLQTATEPTGQRIQFRVRKELQGQVAALQNHPAVITPALRESESCVEPRGFLEIA